MTSHFEHAQFPFLNGPVRKRAVEPKGSNNPPADANHFTGASQGNVSTTEKIT